MKTKTENFITQLITLSFYTFTQHLPSCSYYINDIINSFLHYIALEVIVWETVIGNSI